MDENRIGLCDRCWHRKLSRQRVKEAVALNPQVLVSAILDVTVKAECRYHEGYSYYPARNKTACSCFQDIKTCEWILGREQNRPAWVSSLEDANIPDQVIRLIPKEVAERHDLIPLCRQGSLLTVVVADQGNLYAIDDVKFLTGLNVEIMVASQETIRKALEHYYGESTREECARKYREMQGLQACSGRIRRTSLCLHELCQRGSTDAEQKGNA